MSITEVTPEDAEVYRLERIQGVVAQDFPAGSAARRAGLQQGDVIVAVDGKPILRVGQFQRVIASYHPGDEVKLDVVRYGARRQLKVTLTPAATARPRSAPRRRRPPLPRPTAAPASWGWPWARSPPRSRSRWAMPARAGS